MKDCEALSRIALHYSIFILIVINQTLRCQLITVYCTLVLKGDLTLKFVKCSLCTDPIVFSHILNELEQRQQ